MMKSDDWEKIKDAFAQTIELPVNRRDDFLRRLDEDLRGEVVSLLDAHDKTLQPIIEKRNFSAASVFDSSEDFYAGKQFGHYKILREIGRGGMGAVFLAERSDGEFFQKVALKIVRRSFADDELGKRFRQERQILASLNHPNIARLLDGGVSADGEPYLAMEHVEGVRIDDYCNSKNLSVEERLRLFLPVCRAVSFAHQNLIVHRDIKPSNILVGADNEPKLLDFGIAKLIDAEHAGEQTQTNYRAFTPDYAAPEQKSGESITTATDVYSLGVLLSNLVYGEKHQINGTNSLNGKTKKQSTRTVDQRPKSELDAILQMAQREEPQRRYATVAQFSEDIERYLAGLPVRAQKDSFRYRAGKFISRNKFSVAAIFVVLISLLGGLTVALWQARVARAERDRAERRFADVRELSNALLTDIAPKIERLEGSTEARQSLVKQSLKYLDSLASEANTDTALQAELAAAYEKIGALQGDPMRPNLGDFPGAIASLEKAAALRRNIPPTLENRAALAENFRLLSTVRYGQNDVEGSLRDSEEATKIYAQLRSENPQEFDIHLAAIRTQIEYAETYSSNNQHSVAIPLLQKAVAELEALGKNDRQTKLLLAQAYSDLGNSLGWDDKQNEAEIETAKAVKISETLAAEFPDDTEIQKRVWLIYMVASSLFEEAKDDVALQYAEKALTAARRAVEADRADAQARHNLARNYSRLGICFSNLNNLREAVLNLEKAEREFIELREKYPENKKYQTDFGRLYMRIGDTKQRLKDLPGALDAFQKSFEVFEQTAAADEKNTLARRDAAQSLKAVGVVYQSLGNREKAGQALSESIEILDRLKSENALGELDNKLFDEVRTALEKL